MSHSCRYWNITHAKKDSASRTQYFFYLALNRILSLVIILIDIELTLTGWSVFLPKGRPSGSKPRSSLVWCVLFLLPVFLTLYWTVGFPVTTVDGELREIGRGSHTRARRSKSQGIGSIDRTARGPYRTPCPDYRGAFTQTAHSCFESSGAVN